MVAQGVNGLAFNVPTELIDAIASRVVEMLDERTPARAATSPWLNVDGACEYLGMTKDALYKLTAAKPAPAIPLHRIGTRIMFRRDELDAWLDGYYEGPPRAAGGLRAVG